MRRDLTNRSDAELLRDEDPDAFAEVYDRHASRIYAWSKARVGEHAADLTAEVFARAWLARGNFRDGSSGSAGPWLYGIAANVLRNSLHKQAVETAARRRLGLPESVAADAELEALEERLSLSAAMLKAVNDLSAADREILQLRVVEERPYRQIARQFGCSSAAARLRVSRALRRLHDALAEEKGKPS